MLLHLVSTADIPSARASKASLSHQTCMELLVDKIVSKDKFIDASDEFLDISKWRKTKVDAAGNVREVQWHRPGSTFFNYGGTIDLQWIPDTVRNFNFRGNFLNGTFAAEYLPAGLRHFTASRNMLVGSLEAHLLPEWLVTFNVDENSLTGSVDFTKLPENLREIKLFENKLSGHADLSHLPEELTDIDIRNNAFEGTVDVLSLPKTLVNILLSRNRFSGSLRLVDLPECTSVMWFGNNRFEGGVVVDDSVSKCRTIDLDYTKITGLVGSDGEPRTFPNVRLDLDNRLLD